MNTDTDRRQSGLEDAPQTAVASSGSAGCIRRPIPRAVLTGIFSRNAWGWWIWFFFTAGIVLSTVGNSPTAGDVCAIYIQSGRDLLAGQPLYAEPYFMYLPTAAFFFIPFTWGPFPLLASLWRIVNLAVFAAGVFKLSQTRRLDGLAISFVQISAIVCLLAIGGAKNGQMNLTIAGLLMLSAAAMEESRTWTASALMALSLTLKPTVLPFLLLAAVVHKSTSWRTALLALAMALLPFLAQPGEYMIRQYADVPRMLHDTVKMKEGMVYPAITGLLNASGIHVGDAGRLALRVLFALAALGSYLAGRARLKEAADRSLLLYAIAVGYILLLSPATERNTYAIFAPVVGITLCLAGARRQRGVQALLWLVILSGLLSHTIQKLLSDAPLAYMVKPAGTIAVIIVILCSTFGPGQINKPQTPRGDQ